MAQTYDDEKALIELRAKTGRISLKAAQRQVRDLMETEADRLEKVAGDFWQDRPLAAAYRTKAKELRYSIPTQELWVNGTAAERVSLHKVVTAAAEREHSVVTRLDMLEKAVAADPSRRPIGMPAPSTSGGSADVAKSPLLDRPRRYHPSKPTREMNRDELAHHYMTLAAEADTPAHAAELRKIASALHKEGS